MPPSGIGGAVPPSSITTAATGQLKPIGSSARLVLVPPDGPAAAETQLGAAVALLDLSADSVWDSVSVGSHTIPEGSTGGGHTTPGGGTGGGHTIPEGGPEVASLQAWLERVHRARFAAALLPFDLGGGASFPADDSAPSSHPSKGGRPSHPDDSAPSSHPSKGGNRSSSPDDSTPSSHPLWFRSLDASKFGHMPVLLIGRHAADQLAWAVRQRRAAWSTSFVAPPPTHPAFHAAIAPAAITAATLAAAGAPPGSLLFQRGVKLGLSPDTVKKLIDDARGDAAAAASGMLRAAVATVTLADLGFGVNPASREQVPWVVATLVRSLYKKLSQTVYNTKGTRAHTHRKVIRKWLWEPKGSSLKYI